MIHREKKVERLKQKVREGNATHKEIKVFLDIFDLRTETLTWVSKLLSEQDEKSDVVLVDTE